jgi:hypothetical protein
MIQGRVADAFNLGAHIKHVKPQKGARLSLPRERATGQVLSAVQGCHVSGEG